MKRFYTSYILKAFRSKLLLFCGLPLLLPMSPAFAYNVLHTKDGKELRWSTTTIPYYINTDGLTDFDPASVEKGVQECTQTWEGTHAGFDFVFLGYTDTKSATDDDLNVIFFVQDPEAWKSLFGGQETALAMTRTWAVSSGEIQGFDLAFNDWNYDFTNTDDPEDIETDFANTLTHELGHVLGLDHSATADATMYTTSPAGEVSKRDLSLDDTEGIAYLYRDGFSLEPPPSSCSLRNTDQESPAGMVSLLVAALPMGILRFRRNRERQAEEPPRR